MQTLGGQFAREYLAVIDNRCARACDAQDMPKPNLVWCQYRPRKVLFPSLDSSDSAKAVAANEDGLGALRCVGADPFVELAGMDGALVLMAARRRESNEISRRDWHSRFC